MYARRRYRDRSSSVSAFKGNDTLIDYSATKGAIQRLVRSRVGRGIRVTAVAPGPVWTPLMSASYAAEKTAHLGGQEPRNRAAQPSEIGPGLCLSRQPRILV